MIRMLWVGADRYLVLSARFLEFSPARPRVSEALDEL